MKNTILFIFLIYAASSCTTERKATKYFNNHLEKLAPLCAETFPCITKDSQVNSVTDSTEYLKAIEELKGNIDALSVVNDSLLKKLQSDSSCSKYAVAVQFLQVENEILKKKLSQIKPIVVTNNVVKKVEDSAAKFAIIAKYEKLLQQRDAEINKRDKVIQKQAGQIEDRDNKIKGKNGWIWKLIIVVAIETIILFRKPLIRLINPIKIIPPIG